VLASADFKFAYGEPISMSFEVNGIDIVARAEKTTLKVRDNTALALGSGGIGLLVADGAMSADAIRVSPP
ncbi:MAG: hypothetical protein OXN84_09625, partial [Albidovulum sp.]|nr:hypothetical protein [Albidovulum sp.]